MESIFENTTTLTRQNLTEMARATVPRWSLLVGIIPAVLAVAAAIWDLARRGISLWAGLLLLAAFALVMTTYGAPRGSRSRSPSAILRNTAVRSPPPSASMRIRSLSTTIRKIPRGTFATSRF